MSISRVAHVLRARWKYVLLGLVACVVGSLLATLFREPEYTANLTFYVSAQVDNSTTAAYQGSLLSEQRVASYVELANSSRVRNEVAQALALPYGADELAGQIVVESSLDSVLINVSVTDTDAERAAAIANRIGEVFPLLVEQLERPADPRGVAPVVVRVVEAASAPTSANDSGLALILLASVVGGLIVGAGVALAREYADQSINSEERLARATGVASLAAIPEHGDGDALVVLRSAGTPAAEAYRKLRTNLQFADLDRTSHVFVITSSFAGEGKTTVTTNLGLALSAASLQVLVIEADLRRPTLGNLLGLQDNVGLTTVLTGRIRLAEAVQRTRSGLSVLTAGQLPPNPSEVLASAQMQNVLAEARQRFDYVLIDTPPVIPVTDAVALASAADGVLYVCRYGQTGTAQVARGIASVRQVGAQIAGSVLTQVRGDDRSSYYYTPAYRSQGQAQDDATTEVVQSEARRVKGSDELNAEALNPRRPRPRPGA